MARFPPRLERHCPLLSPNWTLPGELCMYTDASHTGYGGMHGDLWFAEAWPRELIAWCTSISWLELLPILVTCVDWGPFWCGQRLVFHCDNSGVVGACAKGWSRDPRLMSLLRQMWYIAAVNGFTFRVEHVPGVGNGPADALSRLQLDRFRALCPTAQRQPTAVPVAIRDFLNNPTD